jgi:hypothetical protein
LAGLIAKTRPARAATSIFTAGFSATVRYAIGFTETIGSAQFKERAIATKAAAAIVAALFSGTIGTANLDTGVGMNARRILTSGSTIVDIRRRLPTAGGVAIIVPDLIILTPNHRRTITASFVADATAGIASQTTSACFTHTVCATAPAGTTAAIVAALFVAAIRLATPQALAFA